MDKVSDSGKGNHRMVKFIKLAICDLTTPLCEILTLG